MSEHEPLLRALRDEAEEVARRWLERHLALVPIEADRDAAERAHRRSAALVKALGRALSGSDPSDWGDFAHREAVQIATMMAWSLAEAGATPSAAAALYPALVAALEGRGVSGAAEALAPLGGVIAEGYAASQVSRFGRAEQRRLAASTPVSRLPGATILVAATGAPSTETAGAVADRATRFALDLDGPWVVLDLTHLDVPAPAALAALLTLAPDVERLGGSCLVVGLHGERREAARTAGIDVDRLETRDRLADAISEALGRRGILERIRKRFR